MGICSSSPAVKQNAEPAVGQNGHEAGTSRNHALEQPPHAVHEPHADVPTQEPLVTEVQPLTTVVSDQHMLSNSMACIDVRCLKRPTWCRKAKGLSCPLNQSCWQHRLSAPLTGNQLQHLHLYYLRLYCPRSIPSSVYAEYCEHVASASPVAWSWSI